MTSGFSAVLEVIMGVWINWYSLPDHQFILHTKPSLGRGVSLQCCTCDCYMYMFSKAFNPLMLINSQGQPSSTLSVLDHVFVVCMDMPIMKSFHLQSAQRYR